MKQNLISAGKAMILSAVSIYYINFPETVFVSQPELDFPGLNPSFGTSSCFGIQVESGIHNTVTNSSIRSSNLFWKKSYQQHLLSLYWKWTLLWKQNKPLHHVKLSQPPQRFSANQIDKEVWYVEKNDDKLSMFKYLYMRRKLASQ